MKAQPLARTGDSRQPAASRSATVQKAPDNSAFVDNRPEAIAQRELAEAIDTSPYMVAQRTQLGSTLGETTQLGSGSGEENLPQGKFPPVRHRGPQRERLLRGKFATMQRKGPQDIWHHQNHARPSGAAAQLQRESAPARNNTGLPDNLKSGVESLSGLSLDNVRVHYNSSHPARLNALAYAQGSDIHVAPGQERHLPHEAWHVVQQAQGRVRPTMQMKGGVPVNDDERLEREADLMGGRAARPAAVQRRGDPDASWPLSSVVQRAVGLEMEVPALRTFQPRHFYQSVADAEGNPAARESLQKGDVILRGNGFEMEADETTGGGSDVEFVTDPFDEFLGMGALTAAMNDMVGIANHIDNDHAPWKRASALGAFGRVRKPRVIIDQFGPIRAKPQTTIGLRLDQLFEVMVEIGVAQGGEPALDTANRLAGRQQLMSLPTAPVPFAPAIVPGAAIMRVGNATTSVVNGIAAYKLTNPALAHWVESNEVKGLLALVTTYLDAARHPLPNYAKAIAPIMARTDLAQLFRMLPPAEQTYFSHNNGAEWMALVAQIPMLAGMNWALPVFEGGIHRGPAIGPGVYTNPDLGQLNALTRDLWLRGITQGTDRMTRRHFPTAAHRDELESLGSLGRRTEPVGLGVPEGAIFELRGMQGGVPIVHWVTLAQNVLRWTRRKNQVDVRAFGQ